MKNLQVFFIYDSTFSDKEEDSPKGLIYFMPTKIEQSKQIEIALFIMAMLQFYKENFSPINLITLRNGTFSIKYIESRYVLVLESGRHQTPKIASSLIASLASNLTFYYSSFSKLLEKENGQKILQEFCTCFFNVYNDPIELGFDALISPPFYEEVKLSASKLVETCIGFYSGASLFYNGLLLASHKLSHYALKRIEFFAKCPNLELGKNLESCEYEDFTLESLEVYGTFSEIFEDADSIGTEIMPFTMHVLYSRGLFLGLMASKPAPQLPQKEEVWLTHFLDLAEELSQWESARIMNDVSSSVSFEFHKNKPSFHGKISHNINHSAILTKAVQSIHEEFQENPDLTALALEGNQKVVVASQTEEIETYDLNNTALLAETLSC